MHASTVMLCLPSPLSCPATWGPTPGTSHMSAEIVARASGKPMASPSTCTPFTVCTEIVDIRHSAPGLALGRHAAVITEVITPLELGPVQCLPLSYSPAKARVPHSYFKKNPILTCHCVILCPGCFLVFRFSPPGSFWLTEAHYVWRKESL